MPTIVVYTSLLNPTINVGESYPDCSSFTVSDVTCAYNATTCPYGYGSPNIDKSAITKTTLLVTPPGSTNPLTINKGFLPPDGSFKVTCQDLAIAATDAVVVPQGDPNDCGCGGVVIPNPPVWDNCKEGCLPDGCWTFTYQVYSAGQTATWDFTNLVFPDAFEIIINSTTYVVGYMTNITSLITALNNLNLGQFTFSGSTLTVIGIAVYGNIVTSHVDFDASLFASGNYYTNINAVDYYLGAQTTLAGIASALTNLNLGFWTADTRSSTITAYGFNTYGKVGMGGCVYDISGVTFPDASAVTISIDSSTIVIGPQPDATALTIVLNALNKGTFIYNATAHTITAYGVNTYGVMTFFSGVITPVCTMVNSTGTIVTSTYASTPVATDILVGSTTQTFFFFCQIAKQIKNIGMKVFGNDCNCNGQSPQAMFNELENEFQGLMLTANGHRCNCMCAMNGLGVLQSRVRNWVNNCTG